MTNDPNPPANKVDTLGEALPREMARVRDELMPRHIAIGPPGMFALMLMRQALDRAAKAMMEGDVVAMIRCHEELKGFTS